MALASKMKTATSAALTYDGFGQRLAVDGDGLERRAAGRIGRRAKPDIHRARPGIHGFVAPERVALELSEITSPVPYSRRSAY